MNCQDHLYRQRRSPARHPPLVPRAVRRRPGGDGPGPACSATAGYAAAPTRHAGRQSAGAQAASLRAQGQARDLPVHGRRAQPARAVRQQAAAGQVRRHAAAGRAAQGLPRRVHQSQLEAARARSSSSPGTASAAPSSPSCCRTWRRSSTTSPIVKSMATDAFNHAPGQILMNTGSQQLRPAEHGRLGLLRPGQRVAGPARLRRLQHRQERAQRRQLELGQRLPADRLPGRASSAPAATRCSTCRTRRGIDAAAPARLARRAPAAQPAAARRGRRPGDRHADQLLRDGLPHADQRARS